MIWWHVYPLGFLGAEAEALPASAAPVPRLARLERWLDHAADLGCDGLALGPVFASETHGYDTVDHFRVDRRLGTEADLVALVGAASSRGLGVLLDGVFNHVGRSFAASPGWLSGGTFEGHDRLAELDHGNPEVVDHVAGVMAYWLERGIAGWRLDAAYAVPVEFWRKITDRLRPRFPDAWLVGEVIHGDYAAFVEKGGLDSVTQYELWKAIWSSLNDRNLFELAWALDRHNTFLETFAPLTFVGNHDVTRIASRLDDPRRLGAALAVLFTVGGVPSVYAGDERGMRGVKEERAGGDDAIRPAFPDDPSLLPALSPGGEEVHRLHRELIAFRRERPWLARARTTVTALTNTALSYRVSDGERAVEVTVDLEDEPSWSVRPA
ncbi:alpha-amylase family glycosyl hydrolase [Streptosporangium sp. NPDC050855]|uniref:alpha-amylase family glycosyl hydrolase n=1 Tax=Streptosporangium sp. NPDC050855 TaxID=3366194 RepID=UPI003799EA8E